jgi:hypothetical protein
MQNPVAAVSDRRNCRQRESRRSETAATEPGFASASASISKLNSTIRICPLRGTEIDLNMDDVADYDEFYEPSPGTTPKGPSGFVCSNGRQNRLTMTGDDYG